MPKLWIALSGGMDSVVLAHFLVQQFCPIPIHAIHVQHHLHPDAEQWLTHCQQLCQTWQIPLTTIHLSIIRQPAESLEAAARRLRYAAFARYLAQGEILVTAHHQHDQAETLLLQLLRGSGLRGAGAIAPVQLFGRGFLARPLLKFSRLDLQTYASAHQLTWCEDPSNTQTQFDRNFLRHHVLPLITTRWPQAQATLAHFATHCAEQNHLLENLAREDMGNCRLGEQSLSITHLLILSITRRHNLLRYYVRQRGFTLPSRKILQEIERLLISRQAANPKINWKNSQYRRFKNQLFILPNPYQRALVLTEEEVLWCYTHLPHLDLTSSQVTIQFRQGGEKFKLSAKQPRQALKKLCQAWQIPPWERNHIPLLFIDAQLIAIVGYAISEEAIYA